MRRALCHGAKLTRFSTGFADGHEPRCSRGHTMSSSVTAAGGHHGRYTSIHGASAAEMKAGVRSRPVHPHLMSQIVRTTASWDGKGFSKPASDGSVGRTASNSADCLHYAEVLFPGLAVAAVCSSLPLRLLTTCPGPEYVESRSGLMLATSKRHRQRYANRHQRDVHQHEPESAPTSLHLSRIQGESQIASERSSRPPPCTPSRCCASGYIPPAGVLYVPTAARLVPLIVCIERHRSGGHTVAGGLKARQPARRMRTLPSCGPSLYI
ncbi:hypothetical protein C8Q77DRAFT_150883 [Trametes polyzona]|nr:hypothetical protein C8Q77DRAFT_150883 [Trametes polyzona]